MWQRNKPYFLVLPAWIVITALFFGGLIEGVIQSMGYFPAAGHSRFSFSAYAQLLDSDEFWSSLLLTFRTAFLSTIVAGVLGVFAAVSLFMLKQKGDSFWRNSFAKLFQLPLIVPHLVGAYLMVLLFMQSGWFSRIAYHLGWIREIHEFPVWINEPFGWGIIFTYAWKEAPFIAMLVFPILIRIHGSWFEAAQVFGANSWRFLREIVIPLMIPAWLSASFIVFAYSFSSFEVPFLLGVTYPKLLPVLSYDLYTSGGMEQRPEALALNVLLALITAGLGLLAYRLSRRWMTGVGERW